VPTEAETWVLTEGNVHSWTGYLNKLAQDSESEAFRQLEFDDGSLVTVFKRAGKSPHVTVRDADGAERTWDPADAVEPVEEPAG
jgi:hypothetical protein